MATAAAYAAAAAKGVRLVFMENTPRGLAAGKDYVSVVSADNYGNGAASAELMAEALGGAGEVGVVSHAADFFVTRQRREAFAETLARRFPEIRIVAEEGVAGPDFAGDAARAAAAMLRARPGLKGIWAVWDVPAEGVIAAAKAAGRHDLVVTTIDLGRNVALEMARGGVVKGVAAQRVYDQGVTEALLAGYGLLGKPAPAYVALPALPVTGPTSPTPGRSSTAGPTRACSREPRHDHRRQAPAQAAAGRSGETCSPPLGGRTSSTSASS